MKKPSQQVRPGIASKGAGTLPAGHVASKGKACVSVDAEAFNGATLAVSKALAIVDVLATLAATDGVEELFESSLPDSLFAVTDLLLGAYANLSLGTGSERGSA